MRKTPNHHRLRLQLQAGKLHQEDCSIEGEDEQLVGMALGILFVKQNLQARRGQQKDRAVFVAELVQRRVTTVDRPNCQAVLDRPCRDLTKRCNLVSLVVMTGVQAWRRSLTCQRGKLMLEMSERVLADRDRILTSCGTTTKTN